MIDDDMIGLPPMKPDLRKLKIDSISVGLRQDGAHLMWMYHEWVSGPMSVPNPLNQTHHIILKDVISSHLSPTHMKRIHAFAATIAEGDGTKPKKDQKKWEETGVTESLDKNPYFHEAVKKCIDVVRKVFSLQEKHERDFARLQLKNAVLAAYKLFPPEECRTIIDEAIVEAVMKE